VRNTYCDTYGNSDSDRDPDRITDTVHRHNDGELYGPSSCVA
jgi:hypothetical protein